MATIRKKGDKWQVQVRRKGQPHISRSFPIKADALQWARQTEAQADRRGLTDNPRLLDSLTVGDVGKRYRETVLPRKRAGKNQAIILDAFLRNPIAGTRLSSIKPAHFARYRDERLETVKPATINRELGWSNACSR